MGFSTNKTRTFFHSQNRQVWIVKWETYREWINKGNSLVVGTDGISWSFHPKGTIRCQQGLAGVPICFDDVPMKIMEFSIHGFPRISDGHVFPEMSFFFPARNHQDPPGSASYSASLVKTSKAWSFRFAVHMFSMKKMGIYNMYIYIGNIYDIDMKYI